MQHNCNRHPPTLYTANRISDKIQTTLDQIDVDYLGRAVSGKIANDTVRRFGCDFYPLAAPFWAHDFE